MEQEKKTHAQSELDVLDYWDAHQIFKKSVENRPQDKSYVFYDGPPFATGLPHYGHLLASIIKDVVPRFWTMKGFRVERRWGWDCHGIPIENMIEKELDLKGGKKGIEEMGIGKFNAACRAAILRFDGEWEKTIRRIARWVDFENKYQTMDNGFMESVWWGFKTLYEKELVYQGRRVILYCPRCATPLSNFEIAMDNSYKDLVSPSTVYKYKVIGEENTFLLAWSTTPWTKLATPALVVNPDLTYVKVRQGAERYILAEKTVGMLSKEPYEIVGTYAGKDLENLTFELHYDFFPRSGDERAGVVVADDYVAAEEGTGIVTLAVYGEDDYRVMTKHHIQFVEHIDAQGMVKPEVAPWAGMFMLKVNPLVNEDLAKRGLIYSNVDMTHSVPVCYRCETRLYHAPVPAWFINVQKLKPDLLAQNEKINWFPEHLKHGRFGKGLETAPDWNISRSRYWGTPMPVWMSDSGKMRIIGNFAELKEWAVDPSRVESLTDFHREFVDPIEVWVDDARTEKGKRIPEVFDCWVESGSMPFAEIHHLGGDAATINKRIPAQFVTEYIAQTRAWFYVMHVMSVGLFGKNAVENILTTGTILAEDGAKMSKSKKNYPDPSIVIEKYGADAVRFYLMSAPIVSGENLNFSESGVDEVSKKFINILHNVHTFYGLYAEHDDGVTEGGKEHVLDRWIMARLQETLARETTSLEAYDLADAARGLQSFVTDLSTWYIRRSRDRMKTEGADRTQALATLRTILLTFSKMLAPFMPFLAETIYADVLRRTNKFVEGDSVHLQNWPTSESVDETVLTKMGEVRAIVARVMDLREQAGRPIKQALGKMIITVPSGAVAEEYLAVILDEVNVKAAEVKKGELAVELDTALTPELIREGMAREVTRRVNQLRKDGGLTIQDRINLLVWSSTEEGKKMFDEHQLTLQESTLATSVSFTRPESATQKVAFRVAEQDIEIGF